MSRSIHRLILIASLASPGCTPTTAGDSPTTPAPQQPTSATTPAQVLFCAYGGVSVVPVPRPPSFEAVFAVAVVEVDDPSTIDQGIRDFVLLDEAGDAAGMRRVVEFDHFERTRTEGEGQFAYFLNPGGTRPWEEAKASGRTRVRIRVSLDEPTLVGPPPVSPKRCRLTLGGASDPLVIERDLDGVWPT